MTSEGVGKIEAGGQICGVIPEGRGSGLEKIADISGTENHREQSKGGDVPSVRGA
jgi:hypothetical protein